MSASTDVNPSGAGQPLSGPEGPELNEENTQSPTTTRPDHPESLPAVESPTFPCPNPKCGKPLDTFDVSSQESVNYSYYLVNGVPTWEEENNWGGDQAFMCLECGFLLTTDESEAFAFLKDGTVPEGAAKRAASIAQEITA